MAYAFNQLDNYMRRDKEGKQGGGLQKAGLVEAAPTKAAGELAKTAETSSEQGNSAGRFAAMQKAPTGAIAGRLADAGRKQAQDWTSGAEKSMGEYKQAGQQRIEQENPDLLKAAPGATQGAKPGQSAGGQTMAAQPGTSAGGGAMPAAPDYIERAAGGDSGAAQALGKALKPTEMNFQPLNLTAPTLDTTSMLRSGVGGIQSALQQRGGRYTPGMAAMDASAIAASPGAVQALQSQFGGIQQGMRQTQEKAGGLAGELQQSAGARQSDIQQRVREALEGRVGTYKQAATEAAANAARELEAAGQGQARQTAATFSPYDVQDLIQEAGTQQYVGNIDPAYANIAAILGINPEQITQNYKVYSPNVQAISDRTAKLRAGEEEAARVAAAQQAAAAATQGPGFIQVSGGSAAPAQPIPPVSSTPYKAENVDIFGRPVAAPKKASASANQNWFQ